MTLQYAQVQKRQIQWFIAVSIVLAAILQLKADLFIYFQPTMFEQPWRFLTAHWVHIGWIHYLINALALICLPLIFPNFKVKWLLMSSVVLPIVLSLVFYFFYPELAIYAGYSGVLHGLYIIAALESLQHKKERNFGLCILVGLTAKLIWENYIDRESLTTAQLIGSSVWIEAHWFGVLFAILLWCAYYGIQSKTS